jgi:lipopolysaccharide biosynthesis regulator YciM
MNADWVLLLILLLPVAAASGWFAARSAGQAKGRSRLLPPEYFKGLNYVLNEQPDKAIEIFIKMLEVDSETVETHFALGSLFRRRGEVDRAIRIHQNLIARPTLDSEYRSQAMLELGLDYMKLGILDRAEGLFSELVATERFIIPAHTHLLDIYQQEREWDKAITTARKLESITSRDLHPTMAQFHCELASADLSVNNIRDAMQNIKRALNLDPRCVRATLMEADIARKAGDHAAAIMAYRRIEKQDPDYIPEVVNSLRICYQALGQPDKFRVYLAEMLNKYGGITPLLCLTDMIADSEGNEAAIRFISEQLHLRPTVRGVDHLIKYAISRTDGELNKNLTTIKELTTRLLEDRPVYKCHNCGFEAKKLNWKCPGCKSWNSVKPVQGVHGE